VFLQFLWDLRYADTSKPNLLTHINMHSSSWSAKIMLHKQWPVHATLAK